MVKKFVFFLLGVLTATCSYASEWKFRPYMGADAQIRRTFFVRDYGTNLFKKHTPQANLFLGTKIHEYLGFELGYMPALAAHRNTTFESPTSLPGMEQPIIQGERLMYTTTSRIGGINANLMFFVPVNEKNNFIIGLGVARLRAYFKIIQTGNHQDNPLPPNELAGERPEFVRKRCVAQAKVGMQHMLTQNMGLRALVGWENTRKFKPFYPKALLGGLGDDYQLKLRNSLNFGLGITWYFN